MLRSQVVKMWLVLVIFHSLCATLDAFYKNPKQHSLALYSVGTKKIGGAVQIHCG